MTGNKNYNIIFSVVAAALILCATTQHLPNSNNVRRKLQSTGFDPKSVTLKTTANPKTTAKQCPKHVEIPDMYFKSKSGEDRNLMKWFHNICEGSYIEMGGLDGVLFSNSYVFNKALQWKGVLIELAKDSYDEMVQNRPNEVANINAGVCAEPQTLHYVNVSGKRAINGIWEFAAPDFKEKWWKGVTLDSPKVHDIACDRLDSLLLQHAPGHTFFDFFSLDVEGAEFEVVKSIDWDRISFGIIVVEADKHNAVKNQAVRKLIESKGYNLVGERAFNQWYMNTHFRKIYEHLDLTE